VRERKLQGLLCGLLPLAASPAGAAEIGLSKGQLKHAGEVVTQVIAAKTTQHSRSLPSTSNAVSFKAMHCWVPVLAPPST
jgi:hypothetical protein